MALPAINAAHALFRSRFVETSDRIKDKLDAAEREATELRRQLPALALAVEMGEEGAFERLEALKASIRLAEEPVATLRVALQEAERREQARLAEVRAKADKARIRALGQHMGQLRTAAAEYQQSIERQTQLWTQMLKASSKITALLGGGAQVVSKRLNPTHLRNLIEAELKRQAFPVGQHPSATKWPLPGVVKPLVWRAENQISLIDQLAGLCDYALQEPGQFEHEHEEALEAAVSGSAGDLDARSVSE